MAGGRELVVVGRVGRAHGVRGAVRVQATGPTLEAAGPGTELVARGRQGERRLTLAERSGAAPRLILRFEEVAGREEAETLAGMELFVPESELPEIPDADTYYVRDLLGCEVRTGERILGTVTEVHPGPANDALEVASPQGPVLVPFTADAVLKLDLAARRIVIRPDLLDEG